MRLRGALAVAAALATVSPGAALAQRPPGATPAALPSPAQPLTVQPPLVASPAPLVSRFLGRVSARVRVEAGLDERGSVVSVAAVQRLLLRGKADYFLLVPAPLLDALPARGTESDPGVRHDGVLWQGFSPGTRVLAARIVLDPARARPSLPLRVSFARRTSGRVATMTLRISNATRTRVSSFTGTAVPADARRFLVDLRRFVGGRAGAPYPYVDVARVRRMRRTVVARFALTGDLVFPGGTRIVEVRGRGARRAATTIRLDAVLGERPLEVTVRVKGPGRPRLLLTARPVVPDVAAAPSASADGAELLETAITDALELARVRQYQEFVKDPDPAGSDDATYVFRTVARVRSVEPVPPRDSNSRAAALVGILVSVAGAAAALVVWARS